jgi:hypothetical protein
VRLGGGSGADQHVVIDDRLGLGLAQGRPGRGGAGHDQRTGDHQPEPVAAEERGERGLAGLSVNVAEMMTSAVGVSSAAPTPWTLECGNSDDYYGAGIGIFVAGVMADAAALV